MRKDYEFLERIGEGMYGVVMKAKHIASGKIVAVKKIRLKISNHSKKNLPELELFVKYNKQALREAKALQYLGDADDHYVVRCFDVFVHGCSLCIVMEYIEGVTLGDVIKKSHHFPESHIKTYMMMLFKGLSWCHGRHIMHRDIKPANLLVSASGMLRICDFGLAAVYTGNDRKYSHQVSTRWYRAPELLYGSQTYDPKVDIWSAGCIMAEMLNLHPLFQGENDIDQLSRVIRVLGTPCEEIWKGVTKLPDFHKITFNQFKPVPFQKLFPNASPSAIDLLQKLLRYDSQERLSATEALQHPFFHTLPEPIPHEKLTIPSRTLCEKNKSAIEKVLFSSPESPSTSIKGDCKKI